MAYCDDMTADPLGPVRDLLTEALYLGERAADAGDHAGSQVLIGCAVRLAQKVPGLSRRTVARLRRALTPAPDPETDEDTDPAEAQAGALADAVRTLLREGPAPESGPVEPLAAAQALIDRAISIGAPAYNYGDHQGCYDVYACTARAILADLPDLPGAAADRLSQGLSECLDMDDPDAQAWAMRHAFDAVLEMHDELGEVPEAVANALSAAIAVGAPTYNAGDHQGCYALYAETARQLLARDDLTEAAKDVLRAALAEATRIRSASRRAWAMRHAFDRLLGA